LKKFQYQMKLFDFNITLGLLLAKEV